MENDELSKLIKIHLENSEANLEASKKRLEAAERESLLIDELVRKMKQQEAIELEKKRKKENELIASCAKCINSFECPASSICRTSYCPIRSLTRQMKEIYYPRPHVIVIPEAIDGWRTRLNIFLSEHLN